MGNCPIFEIIYEFDGGFWLEWASCAGGLVSHI
jgi:hypothetical protein